MTNRDNFNIKKKTRNHKQRIKLKFTTTKF